MRVSPHSPKFIPVTQLHMSKYTEIIYRTIFKFVWTMGSGAIRFISISPLRLITLIHVSCHLQVDAITGTSKSTFEKLIGMILRNSHLLLPFVTDVSVIHYSQGETAISVMHSVTSDCGLVGSTMNEVTVSGDLHPMSCEVNLALFTICELVNDAPLKHTHVSLVNNINLVISLTNMSMSFTSG